MSLIVFLTVCVLAVSALPLEEQTTRIHGENGWYVPQVGADSKWMSMEEAEGLVEAYETLNTIEIAQRLSLNTVDFYLYTQRNPTEGQLIQATKASIDASNFDATNPTRFTIHGWNSNYQDGVNKGVRDAWFLSGDYNMIAVDWSRGRSLEYASSVAAAPGAGARIALLVDFLVIEYGMSLETLEVVGFSLGAHVAGFTAKQVSTGIVRKVVGLDPASPLYSYEKPEKRLSSKDAFYVETIQTSGITVGFSKPIGRAAFYPNGGRYQPGCGIDLTGTCAHTRAVTYYVESLRLNNFPTIKCSSYEQAQNKDCGSTYSTVKMGDSENELTAVGDFYVPVNWQSPYGLGDVNIDDTTTTQQPTTRGDNNSYAQRGDNNNYAQRGDNNNYAQRGDKRQLQCRYPSGNRSDTDTCSRRRQRQRT
ncbi:PREDICTED: phospholipase A1-like [Drosophila arizonae]|uniref:Phospholipase A1-like n=1 Tax=Drosophila arizonae TaxID=7263 RepID=A0ABM1Q2Q6_DROAR|nr:PREDICTED: phospholipase A1-like [Drosophila arizonae]